MLINISSYIRDLQFKSQRPFLVVEKTSKIPKWLNGKNTIDKTYHYLLAKIRLYLTLLVETFDKD